MGGPRGTPSVDGDAVYAIGTEGDVVCLDAATGALRWQHSMIRDYNGRMMSDWKYSESPLVDGDKLIFTPGSFLRARPETFSAHLRNPFAPQGRHWSQPQLPWS